LEKAYPKLRIYKNPKYGDTIARLRANLDDDAFCPIRTAELFSEQGNWPGETILFRTYFPKCPNKAIGKLKETVTNGLYFEHAFAAGLFFLFTIIYASVVCIISLVIFVCWGKVHEDWVGSSNIAAFIAAIGAVGLALGSMLPRWVDT